MSTTTQKKKLSKSAWLLIFLFIAAIITVTVLAAIGYISLAFLADALVGYMMFGSASWMTATVALVLPFLGGILLAYIVKTYFIGNKVTGTAVATGGYAPAPAYPNTAQQDTETVIS